MATHSGLGNVLSADQTISDDLVITDALTVNGNCALGNAVTDTVGFYGVTAVDQPASANQAALTNTAVTALTTSSTNTQLATRLDQVIVDLAALQTKYNEVRGQLVSLGLMKGSA